MTRKFFSILATGATLLALGLASVGVAGAATPPYTYNPWLAPTVHEVLEAATIYQGTKVKRIPKAVYVRCYTDQHAFETALARRGETWLGARATIAYWAGGSTINMRASSCYLAQQFSGGTVTQDSAGAFKALLHEALHRQGFRNERETDKYAIATMATAGQLVRYENIAGSTWDDWEASRPAGLRAMRLAWQQTLRYAAPQYLNSWSAIVNVKDSWADRLGI